VTLGKTATGCAVMVLVKLLTTASLYNVVVGVCTADALHSAGFACASVLKTQCKGVIATIRVCVVCRVAGSVNSMSALMRVEEADEVNESKSDAASAMMPLSPRRHTMRSLLNDPMAQPDLSTELPADAAEQMRLSGSGALLQSVQQQDRSDVLAGLVLSVCVRSPLPKPARTHLRTHPLSWFVHTIMKCTQLQ